VSGTRVGDPLATSQATSPLCQLAGPERTVAVCHAGAVGGADVVLWLPWALLLSAIAVILGVRSVRRGDLARALWWLGWALVSPALLLTGTLRLVGRVAAAVADWATSVVFSPTTWLGFVLAGAAAALFGTARVLARRAKPAAEPMGRAVRPAKRSAVDDDLADIEEILRRRGIS
jgi:hypothetical protein